MTISLLFNSFYYANNIFADRYYIAKNDNIGYLVSLTREYKDLKKNKGGSNQKNNTSILEILLIHNKYTCKTKKKIFIIPTLSIGFVVYKTEFLIFPFRISFGFNIALKVYRQDITIMNAVSIGDDINERAILNAKNIVEGIWSSYPNSEKMTLLEKISPALSFLFTIFSNKNFSLVLFATIDELQFLKFSLLLETKVRTFFQNQEQCRQEFINFRTARDSIELKQKAKFDAENLPQEEPALKMN